LIQNPVLYVYCASGFQIVLCSDMHFWKRNSGPTTGGKRRLKEGGIINGILPYFNQSNTVPIDCLHWDFMNIISEEM
jgi:hypothetical protein